MNDEQRKRQRSAIQATYRRQLQAGQIDRLDDDDRKSLHAWASQVLGYLVSTITTLEDCELNALRDVLNGKPLKVHQRLRDVLSRSKNSPDGYAIHIARANYSDRLDATKNYTIETLPYFIAYKILQQEEARSGSYRKPQWKRPLPRAGAGTRVSNEQATLWGL